MAGTTVADDDSVMDAFAAAIASRNLTVVGVQLGDGLRPGHHGPVQDRGVPAYLRGRGGRAGGQRRIRGDLRDAVAAGELSPSPARSSCSPPAGRPGSRSACRPASRRSPGTRSWTRSAGRAGGPVPVPADAGRGRPWPDMPLTALLRLGGDSVAYLAVVGDTPSDVEFGPAGRRGPGRRRAVGRLGPRRPRGRPRGDRPARRPADPGLGRRPAPAPQLRAGRPKGRPLGQQARPGRRPSAGS